MYTVQREPDIRTNGSVPAPESTVRRDDTGDEKEHFRSLFCRVLKYRLLGMDARAAELENEIGLAGNGGSRNSSSSLAALAERENQRAARRHMQLRMIDRATTLVGGIMSRDEFLADLWEKIETDEIAMTLAMAIC